MDGLSRADSVLLMLDDAVGPVPRVLLRDAETEAETPVVRPGSGAAKVESSGRYQMVGEIARGGMGAILKGRDTDLGRDLAMKVLLDEHRDNPELVRRFVEEAQIGGQLQHPGIVPVYELGTFADRRPFFTMKLVKGRTLAALLASRQAPADDRPRLLAIFEQVCQTVAYAHARGVIHRDLKPSNVMVGAFGEVQVMDWGLAKVLRAGGEADDERSMRRGAETVIQTGAQRVRCRCLAGRLGAGHARLHVPRAGPGRDRGLDERADVFGLGAILCEILTGRPAYVGRGPAEVQRLAAGAALDDALSRLEASGADPEIQALARDCLAADRESRPRDAGVVAERTTTYLLGVQERLHAAELQRVEAQARVEEEAKRRVLADQLAREAQARAAEARRRWHATAALAVVLVGGCLGMALLWNRADRNAVIARENEEKALGLAQAEASGPRGRPDPGEDRQGPRRGSGMAGLHQPGQSGLSRDRERQRRAGRGPAARLPARTARPGSGTSSSASATPNACSWISATPASTPSPSAQTGSGSSQARATDVIRLSTADANVDLSDSVSGHRRRALHGLKGSLYGLAVSPDGQHGRGREWFCRSSG